MYISVIPIKQRAEALHLQLRIGLPLATFFCLTGSILQTISLYLTQGNFSFLFTATKVLQAIL